MPKSSNILANLTVIANSAFAVAVAWHGVTALVLAALVAGWRPRKRTAAALLSLPLGSVAIAALIFGNPFNASVFALAALGLAVLAARGDTLRITPAAPASCVAGLGLLIFAWVYPHFLTDRTAVAYLYGAPLGIIPCPTLALVVAAALAGNGLVGGAWRVCVTALAAFYAIFGIARLGVTLDVGLLIGAGALLVQHATAAHATAPRVAR